MIHCIGIAVFTGKIWVKTCSATQISAAAAANQLPGKRMCGMTLGIPFLSTPLLHLVKHFPVNNRFMVAVTDQPFFTGLYVVFPAHKVLFVFLLHDAADIYFIS